MTPTRSTTSDNCALWMKSPGAKLEVGPANYTSPAADEVVVRVRAVAVNFVDTIPRIAYRFVLPWLTFPTVIGSDLAGEVVEVGPGVTRLRVGDRVLAHAVGTEKSRNTPAEGAFQTNVVLMEHMVAPIPDTLSYTQACVLPLALSTAACGLFQPDQLGLTLPNANPVQRHETVLVWGASTSVGINAVQLARNAGYRVVATASPRNFDWVRSLGAAEVVDRTSANAVQELVSTIDADPLAGIVAIGAGSLAPSIAIASQLPGTKRVASAHPSPLTNLRARLAKRRGVHVSAIWGATLKDNAVGPAIYQDFLPTALATGAYAAAPEATVVGDGLASIPRALERLKAGISAEKLVVTL
jgi:NADPH:quinone reductase-like Zn-dependent oxidoreductase